MQLGKKRSQGNSGPAISEMHGLDAGVDCIPYLQTSLLKGSLLDQSDCFNLLGDTMAKISGTMHFYVLTSVGIRLIQDFQAMYTTEFKYSFGPNPAVVSVGWESLQKLRLLTKLANKISIRETR